MTEYQDLGRGTCNVCRRQRKLFRYEQFHRRCAECLSLTGDALDAARRAGKERVAARSLASRKAYVCIGGPLDGEFATTYDFHPEVKSKGGEVLREGGIYGHLAYEYTEFNAAVGNYRRHAPSMVFIHESLLKNPIPARQR